MLSLTLQSEMEGVVNRIKFVKRQLARWETFKLSFFIRCFFKRISANLETWIECQLRFRLKSVDAGEKINEEDAKVKEEEEGGDSDDHVEEDLVRQTEELGIDQQSEE